VLAAVLIEAVARAVENDRVGSEKRANLAELKRRYDSLTPREQEVMRLVVSGLLNKQSASELGISEKTIKVHRARVMEKMNVEALAQLVLMAERLGLTRAADAIPGGHGHDVDHGPTSSASVRRHAATPHCAQLLAR
jgi:FixJ family two-component response regulator